MLKPGTSPVAVSGVEDLLQPEQPPSLAETAIPLRELGGKLAGLSLPRQVVVLAVWPLLEQLLNFLVGFVDTALAGRLSIEATNAIGVASYVGWLIGLVQSAVGVGATAIIARATGARHKRLANAALGQSLLLAVFGGLGIGALVFTLAPILAQFTKLEGSSFNQCVVYLRIIALAAPLSAILFVSSACLRGAGDTRSPFTVLVMVNVVNTSLSILLVRVFHLGVTGIALGTLGGWSCGALLIVSVLLGGRAGIRLRLPRLRPQGHTLRRLILVSIPSFVETFLAMWIANFLIIRIVGLLNNEAAWGAHLVAIRIEAISFMPGFATGIAAATLVGQYLGLGDARRARHAALLCWLMGAAVMFTWGLAFLLLPWPLIRLVTDQAALLEMSPTLLRICGPAQVFFATAIVLGQAMRGAGDTRSTMWLTAFCTYMVRLPAVYVLAIVLDLGLNGVWFGLCGELVIRGLIFAAWFLRGTWVRVHV